jgi:hypothetical protein
VLKLQDSQPASVAGEAGIGEEKQLNLRFACIEGEKC